MAQDVLPSADANLVVKTPGDRANAVRKLKQAPTLHDVEDIGSGIDYHDTNDDEDEGSGAGGGHLPPEMGDHDGPDGPGMSDADFKATVSLAYIDAADYIDSWIGPFRAQATSFYRGDPFNNPGEGSKVVLTVLRDAVLGVLPGLLRIFTGGEAPIKFLPGAASDVAQAEQQTDLVNYVFQQDNPGYTVLQNAMKDALVRRTGFLKWRWSEAKKVTETRFTGLPAEMVVILQQDPSCEITELSMTQSIYHAPPPNDPMQQLIQAGLQPQQPSPTQTPGDQMNAQQDQFHQMVGQALMQQQTQQVQQQAPEQVQQEAPTYDVRIRRLFPENRCIIECVPPEEIVWNRDARDLNNEHGFLLIAHRCWKTVGEVVGIGAERWTEEDILQYASQQVSGGFDSNYETIARNPASDSMTGQYANPDDSLERVLLIEAYAKIDRDGDGIPELHKIIAVGEQVNHILSDEIVDHCPISVLEPDPEPHMVAGVGSSMADQLMDLQMIESKIARDMMNGLSQSLNPRTWAVEGRANMDDVMNTEIGATIRVRDPNAVGELVKPFQGQAALQVLEFFDQIKSRRAGISDMQPSQMGDMMQSTTRQAVSAAINASQDRIQLYARNFAEGGIKKMFSGVAQMLRENQDRPRLIRLRGQYVAIDPRDWVGELAAQPTVAMGRGSDQDNLTTFSSVLQTGWQIMQQFGATNPIFGVTQLRDVLRRILTITGVRDVDNMIGQITNQWLQQLAQAQAQQKPDPNLIAAQAMQQKNVMDHQHRMAQLQQNQAEAFQKQQFDREKLYLDTIVKLSTTQEQWGGDPNQTASDANQQLIQTLLQHEQAITKINADAFAAQQGNAVQHHGNVMDQQNQLLQHLTPQVDPNQQDPNAV